MSAPWNWWSHNRLLWSLHDHLFKMRTSCSSWIACESWRHLWTCLETLHFIKFTVWIHSIIVKHIVRHAWILGALLTTDRIIIQGTTWSVKRTWFSAILVSWSIIQSRLRYHCFDSIFTFHIPRQLQFFLSSLFFSHSFTSFPTRPKKEKLVVGWSTSIINSLWCCIIHLLRTILEWILFNLFHLLG